MKKIIVTLTDGKNSFFTDMELPVDYPVRMMYPTIVDLINQNQTKVRFENTNILMAANRQKKVIEPNSTLEEAGIWNGDYITLIQR